MKKDKGQWQINNPDRAVYVRFITCIHQNDSKLFAGKFHFQKVN